MAKMLVIYKTPKNPEAFDQHYFEVHVPLAKKLPGLIKYEVSKRPIVMPTGAASPYLIGTLYFPDMETLKKAFASPEGRVCAEDRKIFASDDMLQMFLFDHNDV